MPILHIIVSTQGAELGYIFEPLASEPGVNLIRIPLLNKKSITKRALRPLAAIFTFFSRLYLGNDLVAKLKNIEPEDSVLFFTIENIRDIRILLRNMPPCKKKSVFFWDARTPHNDAEQKRQILNKIAAFKEVGDLYTFDPDDAKEFGLNVAPQVFREIAREPEIPYQQRPFDLYFIGGDKGRLQRLIDIKNAAESKGLRCNFHITPYAGIPYTEEQKKYLAASGIPYRENIELAKQSRCLLEIAAKNQAGPTLRTMEAAFLGCKLISNRTQANASGLFPASNILILENDADGSAILDFINRPPEKMDAQKLDKHNIKYWWRQFL
ncbi:MAG: hypothetical protein LBG66_00410 [Gallionellaceae bacterium]|jgi:hypothetical protein|nr:hypothetical protein [Gallionellaceae bacterium]